MVHRLRKNGHLQTLLSAFLGVWERKTFPSSFSFMCERLTEVCNGNNEDCSCKNKKQELIKLNTRM